ncbi:molybdopterin-dependent oxidoreductase [Pseudomonas aeruginosa]|nr:molybdopterin-dependent oxidoreductase [Pseudomonas aeruginosa]
MRRRPDGSYEAIDWDTAIREVAEKFLAIKRRHGGESILYYGGGAQGNHLGGAYGDSTLKALGVKYRSNALARKRPASSGSRARCSGTGVHGDFEHCEVAILDRQESLAIPWFRPRPRCCSTPWPRTPARSIIVIDPRLSETAALADFHLQIRPGTDAWCLAALVGIIVQDGLLARDWLAEHTSGYEHIVDELNAIPVAYCAETCGVAEDKLRAAARRIASASSYRRWKTWACR